MARLCYRIAEATFIVTRQYTNAFGDKLYVWAKDKLYRGSPVTTPPETPSSKEDEPEALAAVGAAEMAASHGDAVDALNSLTTSGPANVTAVDLGLTTAVNTRPRDAGDYADVDGARDLPSHANGGTAALKLCSVASAAELASHANAGVADVNAVDKGLSTATGAVNTSPGETGNLTVDGAADLNSEAVKVKADSQLNNEFTDAVKTNMAEAASAVNVCPTCGMHLPHTPDAGPIKNRALGSNPVASDDSSGCGSNPETCTGNLTELFSRAMEWPEKLFGWAAGKIRSWWAPEPHTKLLEICQLLLKLYLDSGGPRILKRMAWLLVDIIIEPSKRKRAWLYFFDIIKSEWK